MLIEGLIKDIRAQKFKPLYLLYGEESYFLDKVVEAIDADGAVLQGYERDFNRQVLYGPETTASALLNACQSFPVMATRRLVILKEGHRMAKKEWEKLASYLKQPVPSTILVLLIKDKALPFGKAVLEAVKANGAVLESKKLYDRDVIAWVQDTLTQSGFSFDKNLPTILVTNLGTNVGLIENELDKLFLYLKATKQTSLSNEFVFSMVNIDKDFNAFELGNALANRQSYRAHLIVDRLTQNTRINPPVMTISALFRLFHMIAMVHRFQLKDANSIKNQLGANYFQAQDYQAGSKNYSLAITYRNLGYIQEADLMLKGLINTRMGDAHILKTLVWKMLN